MPSHPRSPRRRPPPTLAPLVLPTSPTDAQNAASTGAAGQQNAGERTPLLRNAASFGPDDLRRRSQRLSNLLFQHDDDLALAADSPTTPIHSHPRGDEDWLSPVTPRSVHGRSLSRVRSGYFAGRPGSVRSKNLGGGYDAEFRAELENEGGNGVRSWYGESAHAPLPRRRAPGPGAERSRCKVSRPDSQPRSADNFTAIDWCHDAVKHSLRLRRLRRLKQTQGLRGHLVNLWDGLQGWVLVTLIGFLTACIAFAIIRSEMWLFDLKEGYCSHDWRLAERFCCAALPNGDLGDECPAWRTWAQVWRERGGHRPELAAYTMYTLTALTFAGLAATVTIYFTASTSVHSSKDSPSAPSAGRFATDGHKTSYGATAARPAAAPSVAESSVASSSEGDGLKPRPRKTLYYAAGSGIPEIKTILSGFVIRGYLGSWTLGVKAVGLALSVASGLSLGKEGPFVHIASCVGNIISRFFRKYDRNEGKRREILSAACAAGVAVSFGAPVGGVLFSLEEVSYYFPPRTMLRSFWCAMVAAMTLKMLNPFGSGKIVLFAVTYDRDWHTFELLGFVCLAVFGGVYGAVFCKANIAWTKHVRNGTFLKAHPIVEVLLVTLVTTAISFYNPWSKMGGTELISALFSECYKDDQLAGLCITRPTQVFPLVGSLLLTLVLKAALTTVTFG